MELKDRIVFLTGASSGIGAGTALVFARAGARLALCARSKDKLEAVRTEILGMGGEAEIFPADVTVPEQVDAALRGANARFGGIDVVVHCAGTNVRGSLEELTPENWDVILDTNLKSTYQLARLAAPYLFASAQARPAKFLAIGSVGSHLGIPLSAAYCASKGGLVQLIRALAVEWAGRGVCVNAVCPGYVGTALAERALRMGDTRKKVLSRIPMRRLGAVGEIGDALLFLASGRSDYITGTALNVDGGLNAAAYTMDD